ncbi:MAG: histidine phosphatase family protein [Hoeflea sp.]|uniref:SixA phosphatase family protein n=1 Tax=Hoeflea sp. TaxID=1940281 RepID=UPI001DF781A8|nr:histidine phosphatase family protein [Hoeflea sp.]MBU4530438.1 histidine phosphatase family protein [Alphaproteobacteria bacterium]MBU4545225.1 histidine phosphatase family protein [Alphaproteobacteria bacterium]MBU4549575.1 histidine phosphatase family protein [Alphaproteobacteria bacterium]MBV1722028.1 histidine phosphatase family protein [Hoeflea sp.]MBV1761378.1 histidine phosphatase family protein [Hoeflea sp.]
MSTPSSAALRVFLVRHAHAAWAMPGMRDFDRPLDDRGREEAARLAATMIVNGFEPDLVFCSNARRCVETLEVLNARGGRVSTVERSDALYAAGQEAYLELIASVHDKTIRSIMIVGHNPMIEDAASALVHTDPAAYLQTLGAGFPTAGLMIADCQARGAGAIDGSARFVALLSPVDA